MIIVDPKFRLMEALPTLLTGLALLLTTVGVREVPNSAGKLPIVAPLAACHDQPILIRRPVDFPLSSNPLLVNLDEPALDEQDPDEIEDPEVFCLVLFDSETACARQVLNLPEPDHSHSPILTVFPILRC
jgi:hypothetical protein